MSLYRKKPVVTEARQFTQADIEAYLFDKEPLPLGVRLAGASYHPERRTINHAHFTVETLHGRVSAVAGDWILPEPEAGKSYPVTDAVFRETYEPVAAPAPAQDPKEDHHD